MDLGTVSPLPYHLLIYSSTTININNIKNNNNKKRKKKLCNDRLWSKRYLGRGGALSYKKIK